MRVYFEKPRTTVGWKGLINDPHLDGSFAINEGAAARRAGCCWTWPSSACPPAASSSTRSRRSSSPTWCRWGAIGARTTESQVHRELASGLSMPVGFKNGTDGGVQVAIDAVRVGGAPAPLPGRHRAGARRDRRDQRQPRLPRDPARRRTAGPNYDAAQRAARWRVAARRRGCRRASWSTASHGNSSKDYRRQPVVARDVAEQVAAGERGDLRRDDGELPGGWPPGAQAPGPSSATARASPTRASGWDTTVPVLHELAEAVRARRAARGSKPAAS